MYTGCANSHICHWTMPCSCVYMHHASGRQEGGVRSVTLPTERAFILGLSEPTQGEIVGWWSETAIVAAPRYTPDPGFFFLDLVIHHPHPNPTHAFSNKVVWTSIYRSHPLQGITHTWNNSFTVRSNNVTDGFHISYSQHTHTTTQRF